MMNCSLGLGWSPSMACSPVLRPRTVLVNLWPARTDYDDDDQRLLGGGY